MSPVIDQVVNRIRMSRKGPGILGGGDRASSRLPEESRIAKADSGG